MPDTFIDDNQTAYKKFSKVENDFYKSFSDYKDQLEAIDLKKSKQVTNEEIRQVDILALKTEEAFEAYIKLKSVILNQFELIFQKANKIKKIAALYINTPEAALEHNKCRLILKEAEELKIADHIILAIEKVNKAKNEFLKLILDIKKHWLKKHQEVINKLYIT